MTRKGPAPRTDIDDLIVAIGERLAELGHEPTNARVAVVLTYVTGEHFSRGAVRDRRRRMATAQQ